MSAVGSDIHGHYQPGSGNARVALPTEPTLDAGTSMLASTKRLRASPQRIFTDIAIAAQFQTRPEQVILS